MKISDIKIPDRVRKEFGDIHALAESIRGLGLLHPVVVNSDRVLVAGERRLKAVQLLGWDEVPVVVAESLGEIISLAQAERDENFCRKDFTPTEAVAMGERIWDLEGAKAKERQKDHGGTAPGKSKNTCGNLPQVNNKTRDLVGAAVGMSGKTYEKAKAVVAAAKSDPEKNADLLELMDKDGKVDRAYRALARREAVKKIAKAPSDKYRVIYADPPWKYGDTRNGLEGTTGAEAHYPTMSIAELCALPVVDWCDQNSVLFLWVTSPLLFEAEPVIRAWGFQYKACFVWDKVRHNLGHYNSVRHEFLLVCTRGSCLPDVPKLLDSVQSIERNDNHSEKPQEFREIIETLYPHGKRIELFARSAKPGWEVYGNDC